jgi:hypothetical protein
MTLRSEAVDGGLGADRGFPHAPPLPPAALPPALPPAMPAALSPSGPSMGPADGVGVQPGKGVRSQTCPRCTRRLPLRRPSGAPLCEACAAERRTIVRQRWITRWWS